MATYNVEQTSGQATWYFVAMVFMEPAMSMHLHTPLLRTRFQQLDTVLRGEACSLAGSHIVRTSSAAPIALSVLPLAHGNCTPRSQSAFAGYMVASVTV